jgi:hypothetical protein
MCNKQLARSRVDESGSNIQARPGVMMKNVALVMALGLALLAPVAAQADPSAQGCKSSDNKPKKCDKGTTVPEPGVLILLSAGLLGLGGISVLRRKSENQ